MIVVVALERPTFFASLKFQPDVTFLPSTRPLTVLVPAFGSATVESSEYPHWISQIRNFPFESRLYNGSHVVILSIILPPINLVQYLMLYAYSI